MFSLGSYCYAGGNDHGLYAITKGHTSDRRIPADSEQGSTSHLGSESPGKYLNLQTRSQLKNVN